MFGYVSLGGQKFEAFLWEDEEPEWHDCVILYTEKALKHQIVSLHFRVPAERVFLDDKVRENLTSTSTAIADKCKAKLENNERIGKRVSFALPELMLALGDEPLFSDSESPLLEMEPTTNLSEEEMAMEVELMLSRMESGTPMPEEGIDLCDGAMLYQSYEAETFGGRMIDCKAPEEVVGGSSLRQGSTLKLHLLNKQFFLDSPEVSLTPMLPTMPSNFRNGPLDGEDFIPTDIEMSNCGDSFHRKEETLSNIVYHQCLEFEEQVHKRGLKKFSTAPDLGDLVDEPNDDLPPMDDEPSLGHRQAAFVSTRGKEREIWATYREEITATWRAELKELCEDLFTEAAHTGA